MSAATTSPHSTTAHSSLPVRATTDGEDAIPDEDSSEVTKLFNERLQAWKHAVGYLEDYVTATEKTQEHHAKEYEKVLKTVNSPLKEGHHFDQQLGGIAGVFDNIRTNTQGISNSHTETAKQLKGTVLPIFERLHAEIKHKTKELTKGAGKGAKAVDKARGVSQKHIELLGTHTASYEASGGSVKANDDPYIIQRQVHHRLHKQTLEENANREDMLSVQSSFSQFEAHVVATIQTGLAQFNQVVGNQAESSRNLYGDMLATTQKVTPDFEWNGFVRRNNSILIDPTAPKRSVENISFANQGHRSTQPLIAGSLERKSGLLKKYDAGFYAVTPAKYLHEFKSDDDFAKDPSPENSLYLPDCLIGALDGQKFAVKGKDTSGTLSKLGRSKEFSFRAHNADDARKWHSVLASVVGGVNNDLPDSSPASPVIGGSEQPIGGAAPSVEPTPVAPATTTGIVAPATTTGAVAQPPYPA